MMEIGLAIELNQNCLKRYPIIQWSYLSQMKFELLHLKNYNILKLTSVIPDQVSNCHDQPHPLEAQPCVLERHKQESEGTPNIKEKV